jgi:hypothetical protein
MHLGGNDLIVEHGENGTITASYSLTGACSSAQSALNIINSSDLTQYSAGANIDITDHVISGKDWTNEINDASANAYNQSTAWTDSQGYLTGVDLSEYAKTDFVISSIDAATSGKYDTSSFSAISGSFLTAHQSLPQSANWNGATTVVNNNSAIWNNTTNVVSSNSASWGASNPQIPVTGINGIKISESGDKVVFEVSGDYATHDDLTSKQDSLTYGYHDTAISSIDSSALYDNSAHARINTLAGRISDLSSNKLDESAFSDVSGSFLTALPSDLVYTADIADMATTGDINDLVTSIAETYQSTAGMTAYQPVGDYYSASNPSGFITGVPAGTMNESSFAYDTDNNITAYNGSAFAGGGSITGDYVSGVNLVKVPYWEGATEGDYYSANISGDVVVAFGNYRDDNYYEHRVVSLSSMYNALEGKLDQSTVQNSHTLKYDYNTVESNGLSYKATGFGVVSAADVNLDISEYEGFRSLWVTYNSPVGSPGGLYSAIITVAGSAFGSTDNFEEQGWHLLNSGDGSAVFYKYMYGAQSDTFYTDYVHGWYITACDASATYYTGTELAFIAFKDDITGITYTTGSI